MGDVQGDEADESGAHQADAALEDALQKHAEQTPPPSR
jgi:hypothetical protein